MAIQKELALEVERQALQDDRVDQWNNQTHRLEASFNLSNLAISSKFRARKMVKEFSAEAPSKSFSTTKTINNSNSSSNRKQEKLNQSTFEKRLIVKVINLTFIIKSK